MKAWKLCKSILTAVFLLPALATLADTELSPKERLQAQNAEFEKHIAQVANNVYVGVGYAGSNASMIVGDDGVIIVDTLPALASAEILAADFKKISDKPVKAIIYTHGHIDDVGGARMFAGDDRPAIYARGNFSVKGVDANKDNPMLAKRAAWQLGRTLAPHSERISLGVGPAVQPMQGFGQGALDPTMQFDDDTLRINIAGIQIELVSAPGETDDQLFVWLPNEKVLFTGDNFYRSFPNLYAIRGTPYRDVQMWANSLDMMSTLPADVLVPGHTRPITGKQSVHQALIDYRDAIRFVHDETLAGMNRGLTPDELVFTVKLPPHLATRSYLGEFYGRVDTAVRAVFNGYVGWFDGNATHLSNLAPKDEAVQIAALAGGEQALLTALSAAQAEGNHSWALRLADYLIELGTHQAEATRAKIQSLRALAENTENAPTRNYYLSVAHALKDTN